MSRMKPEDLDVGVRFIEHDSFCGSVTAECIQKPIKSIKDDGKIQWKWKATLLGRDEEIDYLITEGFEHYGPRIYHEDSVLLPRYYRGNNHD